MVTNGNGNVNSKVAYMCVSFRCHCHHKMGPQTIYQWCHYHQSPCEQSHMFALNPFMTTKQRFRCRCHRSWNEPCERIFNVNSFSLRKENEVWEGYVFTPVCQSFCSVGGCLGPCPGGVSKPMPRGGGLPRGVSRPRTMRGGIKARVYKNCYLYHHCRTWSDTDFDTDSKTNGCIVLCKTCSHYTDNSDPYSPFLYSTGIQVRFRVCTRIRVRRCN